MRIFPAQRTFIAALPILFGVAGMALAFYPTLFSGFAQIQHDPADTRLLNYVLEHDYRWLARAPGHRALFSPPIFHPEANTAAYTELMLGMLPFYAPWRAAGFAPDTAFQLWMLLTGGLNFVAAYLLLRRCLRFTALASCFGSFLFAFGSPRLNQLNHQSLVPQFFTVLALYALVRVFEPGPASRFPGFWIAVFFASTTAQLYASYYQGWFLLFWLAVALIVAVARRTSRARLAWLARSHRWPISVCMLASCAALAPIAWHYLGAAGTVGYRQFWEASDMLPRFGSWFYMGKENWLYGWTADRAPFKYLSMDWEHRLGLGLVTSIVAIGSLYRERGKPLVRILGLSWLVVALLASMYRGQVSPWMLIFRWLPGANAIRGVCRIGIMELIPAAVGLALFVDRRARPPWITMGIAFFCLIEQGRVTFAYDKHPVRADVTALASQIDRSCPSFFYSQVGGGKPPWECQLDAMWAEFETHVPTVNGNSGSNPRGWEELEGSNVDSESDERRIEAGLSAWAAGHGMQRPDICWVKLRRRD